MRFFLRPFALLALLLIVAPDACISGEDVSVQRYLRSLEVQEGKLRDLERSLAERTKRIEDLDRELDAIEILLRASSRPPGSGPEAEFERRILSERAQDLRSLLSLMMKEIVPIEQAIESEQRSEIFPNIRNKIAAVTYESKSAALGDDISFIISKYLLFSSTISSFAVVNFQKQGFDQGSMRYFDLVEQLTAGHHFKAAIWGKISEFGDTVQIDTFVQIPNDALESVDNPFVASLSLPAGQGQLKATVRPDRVQLQSLTISKAEAQSFQEAAANIRQLRAQPRLAAAVVGTIPIDGKYTVMGRQGEWIKLKSTTGREGWTSVKTFCSQDACEKLLKAASFVNDLVAASALRRPLQGSTDLSRAANDFVGQFNAIRLLRTGAPEQAAQLALDRLTPERATPLIARVVPRPNSPTEVSFANIYYLAKLAREGVDEKKAKEVAGEMAKAVLNDPNNKEILSNLKAIFSYTRDSVRLRAVDEILGSVQ